jgi:hypothetical protein
LSRGVRAANEDIWSRLEADVLAVLQLQQAPTVGSNYNYDV